MAWNVERRATDEDAIRLERAAQAFMRRNDLIPDLHDPYYYPGEEE